MSHSLRLLRCLRIAAVTAIAALFIVHAALVGRAALGSISGVAFEDVDRDGSFDAGEPPMAAHSIYLFDGSGAYLAQDLTDEEGRYSFEGLTEGPYRVEYDSSSWSLLKNDWVPTSTGTLRPASSVQLALEAVADFGWRPISWSTDLDAPISTYVGSNGLRVQSYNDAVTARDVYDAVMNGWVGEEASHVSIRFGYGSTSSTTTTNTQSGGSYTSFTAASYVSYESWLNDPFDQTLGHEYGHAWSLYYATMVHQDPAFTSYLQARGLTGDPRLNTSYAWSARELIAEDYRQLLGSPTAATGAQANTAIPPASQVPGLKDFFTSTFGQPAPPPSPTPSPPATTEPTVSPIPSPSTPSVIEVVALTISPSPVKSSATVAFGLTASAAVDVVILDGEGQIVASLLDNTPEPGGTTRIAWNRRDQDGRRVRPGTYRVRVVATDHSGASSSALVVFLAG